MESELQEQVLTKNYSQLAEGIRNNLEPAARQLTICQTSCNHNLDTLECPNNIISSTSTNKHGWPLGESWLPFLVMMLLLKHGQMACKGLRTNLIAWSTSRLQNTEARCHKDQNKMYPMRCQFTRAWMTILSRCLASRGQTQSHFCAAQAYLGKILGRPN